MGIAGNAATTESGAAIFTDASRTGDLVTVLLPDASPTAAPEETREATFEEVIDRYQTEIYRYALHLTRDRMDADDLYQETLLKAYRAFGRLDGAAYHRAWLYRIATNTFLSDRRKQGRVACLDDEVVQVIPAAPIDHAAGLDARDALREVVDFIAALPPKQRAALTLRKYHELDYAEIAATLQSSEGAARASVYEALRKLRERFGDRPGERED